MAATVWRGRLAFGLVAIPVRLYKAARRERIRFHHVYRPAEAAPQPESLFDESDAEEMEAPPEPANRVREFSKSPSPPVPPPPDTVERVRNAPVAESSERPVDKSRVLKGYEIEKDRFVTFEPAEVAALRPETSTELDIGEFVRLSEIDPIFFETSYYAAPDRGGEKPYALLFRALVETGYAAIGSLAMHRREHATVIRPGRRGLILHTLYYNNEVRAEEEYAADAAVVNAKELDLAKRFVDALAAPFDSTKLKDSFEERLRELIEARAAATVDRYGPEAQAPAAAPVVDITEALKRSLEMVKRPPKKETGTAPAKPRRKRQSG